MIGNQNAEQDSVEVKRTGNLLLQSDGTFEENMSDKQDTTQTVTGIAPPHFFPCKYLTMDTGQSNQSQSLNEWEMSNFTMELGNNRTMYPSSYNNCFTSWVATEEAPPAPTSLPQDLPREMIFNGDSLVSVISYIIFFTIAAFGNLVVFTTLFRNRRRKSRVNLFIMHLSLADLIVTFVMLPLEIGWHITVAWKAGDVACRLFMFCRAFGFYLSSFILISISLDRYFAISHPLSLSDADKRGKLMLFFAWTFSFLASIPQSVIFHVEKHPAYPWFTQCVTFNFFPTPSHELAYNLFNMAALYGAPLVIIIISYTLIILEITKRSRQSKEQTKPSTDNPFSTNHPFRRSGIGRIEKARIRTLKMTVVIVLVFIMCWTPYFVMSAWWWIDKDSARKVDSKIQRALFLFAVSNSCVNPIVYGTFSHSVTRVVRKYMCWKHWHRETVSSTSSKLAINHLPVVLHSHQQPSSLVANEEDCIIDPCLLLQPNTCIVAVESESSQSSFTIQLCRQDTPPHIAQGKGMKECFDKYYFV